MNNPMLTEQQAAYYIAMSASWLKQVRLTGNLPDRTPGPVYVRLGRNIRYLVTDLDAWLEARRVVDGGA